MQYGTEGVECGAVKAVTLKNTLGNCHRGHRRKMKEKVPLGHPHVAIDLQETLAAVNALISVSM